MQVTKHMALLPRVKTGIICAGLVASLGLGGAAADEEKTLRSISVTGQGEVRIRPDVARSNMGVQISAPTVRGAMDKSGLVMGRVRSVLEKLGVADGDIATSNFSIHYQQPRPKEDRPGSYQVSNMVQVTIRDLEQVDAVLDGVTKAGANQVWGVRFVLDDTEAAEEQARALAVEQARRKAEALANLHGVKLGPVISVREGGGGHGPQPVFARTAAVSEQSLSPGELTFSAQIHVVYGIE